MQIEKEAFYRRTLFTAFWIRGTWGFFAGDFVPAMASVESLVYLLFDAVIAALGLALMRRRHEWLYMLCFLAASYIITCGYNHLGLTFYVNGLREFVAYMFIIPILRYFLADPERKERFIAAMDKNLFWFLVIQTPCSIFQFLKNSFDMDLVGGSLGPWYSGIESTIIFAISFYLMRKRLDVDHFWQSLWENKILIILLLPTQLNETKVSFVYFALYLLLLMPLNRKSFVRMIAFIPCAMLLLGLMYMAYTVANGISVADLFTKEEAVDMYLIDTSGSSAAYAEWIFDNDVDEIEDVPRFAKLALLTEVSEANPGHEITGFGIGHFKGGTMLDSTKLAVEYDWLFFGAIPYIFHLLIQLGLVGVALFVAFMMNLFSRPSEGLKRDYNIHFYFIANFVIIQLYNDSIRNSFMMLILMYIIMASWRVKDTVDEDNPLDGSTEVADAALNLK